MLCIIEIIKSFDIIAVQEVKGNIKCLRETMKALGEDWSFIITDVTKGNAGNYERLAFIFNTKKVSLSGIACEIVIPKEQLDKGVIGSDALDRQFARTPYAVSFKAKDKTFVLLTLHVLYGDSVDDRIGELKALADWIHDWAISLKKWGYSLITLGDFNIEKVDGLAYKTFIASGLYIPDELKDGSRTIFGKKKLYDQIAWFATKKLKPQISLEYIKGGTFHFPGKVLRDQNYTTNQLSYRISDHVPLWAEFKL